MRLRTVLLLFIAALQPAACAEPGPGGRDSATAWLRGTIHLDLNHRSPVGLYLTLRLRTEMPGGGAVPLVETPPQRITDNPVELSLPYPRAAILPSRPYYLDAVVTEDPGGREVVTLSAQVLTQGHPSEIHMAYREVPEPVEQDRRR